MPQQIDYFEYDYSADFGEQLYAVDDFYDQAAETLGEALVEQRRLVFETALASAIDILSRNIYGSTLSEENKRHYLDRLQEMQGNIVIDILTPPGVGGYYSTKTDQIGIPPMIALFARPATLLRVLSHELNHGVLEIFDEGLTDWLSLETTGGKFEGVGYEQEVNEYDGWFGHLDAETTIGLLDPDPEVMLMKMLLELAKHNNQLDPEVNGLPELKESLRNHWQAVEAVFPTLMQLAGVKKLNFEDFWQENQQRMALMFWGSPERMRDLES